MINKAWVSCLSLAAVLCLGSSPVKADLLNDTVTVDYLYPDINTVYQNLGTQTVTVGGVAFNSFGQHNFTVFPDQITLTNVSGGEVSFTTATFNGYQMTNLSGSPAITGVTIDPATTQAGLDPSRVLFDATDVWLNMQSLITEPGQDVVLDLSFGTSPVPEPSSVAGIAAALLSLVALRRRARKNVC